jgi:MFS family permease
MNESSYPPRNYAWTVVALLIATAILSYTDRQVLTLLVDPIRHDLHLSDTGISLLLGSAFAVVYGIAGIPLGYLADRTSRRNLIVCGIVVWSCATLACGLSRSFAQLFIARLFVGLGEAVLSPAAISLISDYFPPARRGTAVGLFLSGIAMGVGTAILIGGAVLRAVDSGLLSGTPLAHVAPWRVVLLLIGAPGIAWSFVLLLIREPEREPERRQAETPVSLTGPALPSLLTLSPIYIVVGMASLIDNAVGAWAPSLLIREFAKDPAQVGIELGILLTIGYGGGVFLGGVLADRVGLYGGWRKKLRICLAAAILILPVCLVVNASSFLPVLLAIAVYFALSGIVTAVGFSSMLDIVPNRSRGLAIAVSFFLNVAIGAGVGPTTIPLLGRAVFGEGHRLGPSIALTAAAGYLIVIAALLASFRQRVASLGTNHG